MSRVVPTVFDVAFRNRAAKDFACCGRVMLYSRTDVDLQVLTFAFQFGELAHERPLLQGCCQRTGFDPVPPFSQVL
jgi:hypothetical protein